MLKSAKVKLETDKNATLQITLLNFIGYIGKSCDHSISTQNSVIIPSILSFSNSKQKNIIYTIYNTLDCWCHYDENMTECKMINSISSYLPDLINTTNVLLYYIQNKIEVLIWLEKYIPFIKEHLNNITKAISNLLINNQENIRIHANQVYFIINIQCFALLISKVNKNIIIEISETSINLKEKIYYVYKEYDITPIPFKYAVVKKEKKVQDISSIII